ncbi:unnamed protein product [Litomosoides sigmodontis]|uniref:Uncharacterized protein n=1 Tax=Litomosoides sigmodontis TaxID=42156 RepID=A0A3P6U6U8_LITSI|nr:unnamed protein product [Litomosoides sigmodontis]
MIRDSHTDSSISALLRLQQKNVERVVFYLCNIKRHVPLLVALGRKFRYKKLNDCVRNIEVVDGLMGFDDVTFLNPNRHQTAITLWITVKSD